MASAGKIRVQGSQTPPFRYSTAFILDDRRAEPNPVGARHLYGDGDLAVFLEDLGIDVPSILLLLRRVSQEGSAETHVRIPAELLNSTGRRGIVNKLGSKS